MTIRLRGALLALFVLLPTTVFAQATQSSGILTSTTCPGSGCVTLPVVGLASAGVQINNSGTYTATFEGSIDGSNFTSWQVTPSNSSTQTTTASGPGLWSGSVGGFTVVRVRLSAYTSGAPAIYMAGSVSGGGAGGGGGGSGSNAAASATGSSVPAQAGYTGINIGGTLTGLTGLSLGTARAASIAVVDGSGNQVTSFGGSNAAVSATGAAVPASATYLGANSGGNLVGIAFGQAAMASSLPVTFANNQTALPASQSGTWTMQPGNTANTTAWLVTGTGGTFPATESGTWTVQPGNTANTTAWLVAGGKTNNNAAPGATNFGSFGFIANAAPPTWTEGNLVAGSVDLAGNTRVICISGCAGSGGTSAADRAAFTYGATTFTPVGGVYNSSITALTSGQSGAVALTPTRDQHTALYDASGTALGGQKNMAGSIPVVLPSDQFVADTNGTLQSAAVANGNGSTLTTGGLSAAMVTVNCSGCSGGTTVNFEGTEDSSNYVALQAQLLGTNTLATSTTTSGITEWQIPVGAVQNIRARVSGYSAGTITVTGHASSADFSPKVTNTNVVSVPANQSVNVAQVNGSTVVTAATGVQKVGIGDGAGTSITSTGGALDINIKSGGGSGGTALADAATFTQATTSFTPVGGIFTNSVTNLTTGQAGVAQLTNDRMLYTNIGKVGGTATDTNSGTKSAGTLRVVIATDQPALSNKLLVTPDSVALPANQSVNESQINGVTVSMNTGSPDTGTQRIIAADGVSECAIVSAASTNATNCKAGAGNFLGLELYNTTTTVYYLRLYNTVGAPTCSSATGFIRSIPVPPAAAAGQVGGAIVPIGPGVSYGTGVAFCLTGGSSSTDNTNAAVGIFGAIKYR